MRQLLIVKEEIPISNRFESTSSQHRRHIQQRYILTIGIAIIVVLLVVITGLLLLPENKEKNAISHPELMPVQAAPAETTPAKVDAKIPKGVTISGISVGGMTKQEAVSTVKAALSDVYISENMVVMLDEHTLTIAPDESEAHLDIEEAVQEALVGNLQSITPKLFLNHEALQSKLQEFYDTLGGIFTPSGYWLEGDAPNLETKEGQCQTLVLNPGTSGHLVDFQDAIEKVLAAYENEIFTVTLDSLGEERQPDPLDLDRVSAQISVPAQNPRIDPETLSVIPGRDGYGFDQEKASALLESAASGEPVRLLMEYTSPEVSEEDAWFQDTLGYCKTEHSDNENRNINLKLACEKLNGLILQPGETLSYNEILGKRTREAGYMPAPAYSGTDLVDEVGGGICQVSSTLYLSALFAELTVVERKNHGFPASYIPLGLDATVNWGTTDLKLRNDYELPVKIVASVDDGYVKIKIMGVEQRDYYVKMEYRVDDHPSYAAAYRCLYSRETDEQISRTLDHTSVYLEDVWCWPGFAENSIDEEP